MPDRPLNIQLSIGNVLPLQALQFTQGQSRISSYRHGNMRCAFQDGKHLVNFALRVSVRRLAFFAFRNLDALHRVAAVKTADTPCICEHPTKETLHVNEGYVRKLLFCGNAIQQSLSVSRAESKQANPCHVRSDIPIVEVPVSLYGTRSPVQFNMGQIDGFDKLLDG